MLGLAIAYKPTDTTPPSAAGSCAITQPKAATAHSAGAAHPDAATPPATAAGRRMPDLATIGLVCRSVDCNLEAAALTTNLTKALFFEKNARKTQNKTRRGRLLRAARRYLLAAAKELEPLPRPPASRKKKTILAVPAFRHRNQRLGSAFRQRPRPMPELVSSACDAGLRQATSPLRKARNDGPHLSPAPLAGLFL